MKKFLLIGVNICIVILFILSTLTNIVGLQTVQSSNQNIINNEIDNKELLFRTIFDIANNKEIKRIILKSQMNSRVFFNLDVKFSVFNTPVLTKNQLRYMYIVDLILSKTICKTKIHSMVERYQLINQEMQKEINDVIEKDATLNSEIIQLSKSECDCENENTVIWHFPVICILLVPILWLAFGLAIHGGIIGIILGTIMGYIGSALHCFWY